MLDKNYYEELVEKTLSELESKLGLDISSTSNTRQIVEKSYINKYFECTKFGNF